MPYGYQEEIEAMEEDPVLAGDRGDLGMAPDHWRESSLITNLDKVKTPLMLLWGDRDGTSVSMADDYFRVAKERGLYTENILAKRPIMG